MTNSFLVIPVVIGSLFQGATSAHSISAYYDYAYDPNDFAVHVLAYSPTEMGVDWLNGQPFNNPLNALGRPTLDTTGDSWFIPEDQPVPVNPVYPAFRSHELVFLGERGSILLQFNHPVRDDENNPYGIDFIVFGNAMQIIGGGRGWTNGDPTATTVGSGGFYEPGIVSVSQDGLIWYSFTTDPNFMADDPAFVRMQGDESDGPFCDSFAPTLGRIYDPMYPDAGLGLWNAWWAGPTNPTCPVDPNWRFDSFDGFTVAEMCLAYGPSAGGTGYDMGRLNLPIDPVTGKKWFQYIRIDDRDGGGTAEIDAVSDVSCCGDWKHPYPTGDINQDCRVNSEDFAEIANRWMYTWQANDDSAQKADLYPDHIINIADLRILAETWLNCSWDCP